MAQDRQAIQRYEKRQKKKGAQSGSYYSFSYRVLIRIVGLIRLLGTSNLWKGDSCNISLRLYREQALQYARQPLQTKYSRYGGSIGCYRGSIGCYRGSIGRYGRRSIRRSSKDSRKEFEGVSDRVLSEQLISKMIDIRGIVKLLGKGKLEFNRYLRLQYLFILLLDNILQVAYDSLPPTLCVAYSTIL